MPAIWNQHSLDLACQEWRKQHVCPICSNALRNSGATHDAWAYFEGCLTHLASAPKCIGYLLSEDPLSGPLKPMTSSVEKLLAKFYPDKSAREWLPVVTILYMAPGGHRQWPMSISALLERLSWLVFQTRPLALQCLQEAVQSNPKWKPRFREGPLVTIAPSTPFKFLDIGTKMGCYQIEEHIPGRSDVSNIFHPRFTGNAIPPANTFHAVIYERTAKWDNNREGWCTEDAWFAHSPEFDFRIAAPF